MPRINSSAAATTKINKNEIITIKWKNDNKNKNNKNEIIKKPIIIIK